MPLHGEQARFARMQKKVNDVGLFAPMIGRVLDWIDPNDLMVRRCPHKSLQLPNQIVMVCVTRAESVEIRLKNRFAYCGCLVAHRYPSAARDSAKNTFEVVNPSELASSHNAGLFG
jgi:hypothetical protein